MTTASILIVEDEIALAEVVRDYLLTEGMSVEMLSTGAGAVELAQAKQYDLIILDLMLPAVDGLTICRDLRKTLDVPIIMTTAKVEEIDRLLGLELGADDYLCKPYSPRELVARVRAVLRRRPIGKPTESPVTNDRLIINGDRWQATLDGSHLDLTRREFSVLQALASRPGRVFSRDQLLSLAFPDDTEVFDRTVDSHIRNIRRKIASVSTWDPIRSVYGVGYAYDG
ncbi:response regulator [Sulfitobacter sp. BSw21498]|uniref:response regulator n=1 Tax=Sulfitobacter sp. BSw21498 TaxID=664426 RepID=UPI0011107E58|nr:response regulator [Sulfitobacter sp. BSw21498]|tara:strand:+ start:10958 stop:11638 length:681 start_codon:yes stop_codon:yes gene_type:complete